MPPKSRQHEPKEWLKVWDAFVAASWAPGSVYTPGCNALDDLLLGSNLFAGRSGRSATARGIPAGDDGNRGRLEAPEAVTPSFVALREACGHPRRVVLRVSRPSSSSSLELQSPSAISSEILLAGLGVHVLHDEPGWQASVFRPRSSPTIQYQTRPRYRSTQCRRGPVV